MLPPIISCYEGMLAHDQRDAVRECQDNDVRSETTMGGMPPAEIEIGPSLVRALLNSQHPDLADLPLLEVGSGWDNHLYRLGDGLAARLPRRAVAAALIEHEQRWLPQLARGLPLPVPVPVRIGRPGCGYPWSWSVVPWLIGQSAVTAPPRDAAAAARELGTFLRALHQPAPQEAPRNPMRGVPLSQRWDMVHNAVRRLGGIVDRAAVMAAWERAVRTPAWGRPPVWIHGDLHPGNLLVRDGRLSAVIDFGDLTAGDPATDLSIAWMLLPPAARPIFRASVRASGELIDDHTWERARGWAMTLGLAYLAGSEDNEAMAVVGRATIDAAISDGADPVARRRVRDPDD
jgi:aminoglycoside phosphotransferase (APT) family kinase protein